MLGISTGQVDQMIFIFSNKFMRVNKIKILIVFGVILCSFSMVKKTYQTECVTLETDGFVTIKIWDPEKGAKYKLEQARKDAINAILFSGVAAGNNCFTQQPILDKPEEHEKFKNIEKSFFSKNGKWLLYTRSSSIETTIPEITGTKNWKIYQVSISKNKLRKYLEEEKVITALNKGF